MNIRKYDTVLTGFLSGLLLPFIVGFFIYLFSGTSQSLRSFLERLADSDIITHTISLCVFPNIVIFLLFNRFDMLRASRGVLTVTILWAILVFTVKLF